MNVWRTATFAIAAICLGQAAWHGLHEARAQDTVEPTPTPNEGRAGAHLHCRVFPIDVADTSRRATLETADRTSEIGQWVGEREDAGMFLSGVDFEVGQRSTGFPQGYVQVCMAAR